MQYHKLLFLWPVILGVTVMSIALAGPVFTVLVHAPVSTGVCIFKGQPFYAYGLFGGTQSSGIPLRNIQVTAYDSYVEPMITGTTDRLGCFSFQYPSGQQAYASYTYNGTQYMDPVTGGTILQDNVP